MKIIIEVKGGLVQAVYANGDVAEMNRTIQQKGWRNVW